MCGRFTLSQPIDAIASAFNLRQVPPLEPRYNIAPTQLVPAILQPSAQNEKQLQMLRWGLIPSWAKEPNIGVKLINARAETVSEKPSFKAAFKRRRCLIVADGFYEWQRQEGKKQPYYFRLKNLQAFAFAGLWEHWLSPDAQTITSCTILTTEANDVLRPIHDRMPVIIDPKDYLLWLNPAIQTEQLLPLLRPYQADLMTSYAVSNKVNSPKNNTPECINSL
ncbi:SOS response-associated peptidase [Synechocystis sp. PCC 7509]|uniref:SOS response-associated peptidase n=1 Tax=Synechocystis sp. PCC 7509 TaxID=927677 RepID=UPI0002AD1958|nr:SOS response-associated peptidase [Synechocystis sp. PCC 7509]